MIDFGSYSSYILGAYGVAALCLSALIVISVWDGCRQKRLLDRLDHDKTQR